MNKEREKAIIEIALKEKRVTVKDLAKRLYASEPSIRRDLSGLEKQNLLKRTHGGAILDENAVSDIKIPFLIRELEKTDEKIKIARKAAELITDGSVIFLDASTSAYNMVPFLAEKMKIVVITNGIKALTKLSEYNISCIGTGGKVINSCLAFAGEMPAKLLSAIMPTIAFSPAAEFRKTDCSAIFRRTKIWFGSKCLSIPQNHIFFVQMKNSAKHFLIPCAEAMSLPELFVPTE